MVEGLSLEKEEKLQSNRELESWEQIYREENSLSLEERKTNQLEKLRQILQQLHTIFGTNLVSAIKKARGENLSESESGDLQANADGEVLISRVAGMENIFGFEFYQALEEILGEKLFAYKKPEKTSTPAEQRDEAVETESVRTAKLPKGFNKWDLKMIKLHESHPAEDKRIWVEYWSLKGISDVGEILYNPSKGMFYFKPKDSTRSSFALSDENARKASPQARNYYFRVAQSSLTEVV